MWLWQRILSLVWSLTAEAVTSASVSPSSQTVAAGTNVNWTASWAGTAPYTGYFEDGYGSDHTPFSTSSTSKGFSKTFPILCQTVVYTQHLWVSDVNGGRGATSTTTVDLSHSC